MLDSTRVAQKQRMDSTRAARQHFTDSIKVVRERRTDSLERLRKYRESRKYQDSVAKVKQKRLDSIQDSRATQLDAQRAARQKVTDSVIASRKTVTDALKSKQQKRTDSLAAIRKYRESKRYQDSTALAREQRLETIKQARKAYNDSVAAIRKAQADSLTAIRTASLDSATAVRTKRMDSVKNVRKLKADSLAKIKERRQKNQEARLKDKEEKMKLAFELKLKKKREAWSNEKMLKKRWSLPRQVFQNTYTRYNYYFNADKKMDEALENMQRMRKENYDSTLALFPFDPDRDSSALAADMDSIIQKSSVGIQIHDPRTKWGDDLYLLLGQAYYYKGKYEDASTSFRYIVYLSEQNKKKNRNASTRSASKKVQPRTTAGKPATTSIAQADDQGMLDFLKHRSVHNEALLWLARTYTESNQPGNAESVLDLLETDPNMPESMRGRLAVEKAYVALNQNDIKAATEQLGIVANDKSLPDWLRQRAAYLNGQLYQERGDYSASAIAFQKVINLQPKIDMDFYARKNLAYSLMLSGGDQQEAVASLKRVLNDGKYVPYYEQVYYVMGRLAANSGKPEDAVVYLRKGLDAPRSTKKQKALSYAALGGVYYNMHDYVASKKAYDSAVAMGGGVYDSLLVLAARRGMALGNVSGPLNTIKTQDSLLKLAAMSEKEQYAAVRKYIRYLENQKNDSAFNAENRGINAAMQMDANMDAGGGGGFGNWYFANATLMQQGYNEFKRKWGGRPLVDNWRRSAALSMVSNKGDAGPATEEEESPDLDENGLPTEQFLIAAIPNDKGRQEQARTKIRRAYVDLADAYIKQLEDYPPAIQTLDTLDKRFPAHEHKAEVLYLRYLVALRQNKLSEAQQYTSQILSQYGDSKWAKLIRPTEDGEGMLASTNVPVASFYDETYGMLLQRQYPQVLQKVREGQRMYTDARYLNRFRIMEAIASVGVNDYDHADTLVTDFISKNPTDSLRAWADAVLQYIKRNRVEAPKAAASNLQAPPKPVPSAADAAAGSVPVQAPVNKPVDPVDVSSPDRPNMTPPAPATPPAPVTPPATFTYNPQEAHYVVFTFRNMEQRAMGVKAAITDFNTFKFGKLGLESKSEMISPDLGMVVTRKFQNAGQAKIYLNSLRGTAQVFREYKSEEYQLLLISEKNYLKVAADKTLQPYMQFYRANYK
ncbi:hypothetical protein [Polluticoccus soli]|uniref:type IX secretion system periplasmic lipoprotein PorW/SprE n=1 Tax=Polluticoccus soli TaxID=3034150 RepID=UPI0023E14233|nr:hypothetical protein [Flavipsychrobacter sp. JY13-12]